MDYRIYTALCEHSGQSEVDTLQAYFFDSFCPNLRSITGTVMLVTTFLSWWLFSSCRKLFQCKESVTITCTVTNIDEAIDLYSPYDLLYVGFKFSAELAGSYNLQE